MPSFTPAFDLIVDSYADELKRSGARDRALVYGEIFRHSMMRDGFCHASIENMAEEIALVRSTFKEHLKALVRDGWLECLHASKGGRGKTSHYSLTSKLEKMNDQKHSESEEIETLRRTEGLEITLSSTEGLADKPSAERRDIDVNPPLKDVNPPQNGGEDTRGEQLTQKIKKTRIPVGKNPENLQKETLVTISEDEAMRQIAQKKRSLSEREIAKKIREEKFSGNGRSIKEGR
jgi:DNA-binding MarR family transcriptional regulator